MIQAIIFDCFGVLYRDNIDILYDAVPPEKTTALQDIIHATDYGMLSRDEYYRDVADLAGKTPDEIRALERRQHDRDPQMIAYTQSFRPRYKVGLLSNIDSDTIRRLFPDHETLFDGFVASGDVGMTKPSPEIFALAAAQLGMRPEECVMVDDLPKNVDGARMAGMEAVLFTTQAQLTRDLSALLGAVDA